MGPFMELVERVQEPGKAAAYSMCSTHMHAGGLLAFTCFLCFPPWLSRHTAYVLPTARHHKNLSWCPWPHTLHTQLSEYLQGISKEGKTVKALEADPGTNIVIDGELNQRLHACNPCKRTELVFGLTSTASHGLV